MKVVVTGASGWVGQHLVAALLVRDHEVVATSRSGRTPQPRSSRVHPLAVDLDTEDAVEELARELGSEAALIHLAWAHSSNARDQRRGLFETNVFGTMRVLDAARSAGVRAVIYASSFEVYGATQDRPLLETSRVQPLTDYGAAKLAGEDHLLAFAEEQQVRVVALRFPALYGPGGHGCGLLSQLLQAVAAGKSPVIQGDSRDQHDLLHVRDAASACLLAVESDGHGIINVASGRAYSTAELAELTLSLSGRGHSPEYLPRIEPRRDNQMSIEKARQQLGFASAVPLEAGIAEQLAWLRSQADGTRV